MPQEKRKQDEVSETPIVKEEDNEFELPLKKSRSNGADEQVNPSVVPQSEWPEYFQEVGQLHSKISIAFI